MKNRAEITREEIFDYYIVNNKTRKETQEHFNLTKCGLEKLLIRFNIRKGKFETFSELKNKVTKDMLNEYYIIDNHSWEETKKHFNLTTTSIDKLLREYNLNKIKNKEKFENALGRTDLNKLKEFYSSNTFSDTAKLFELSDDNLIKIIKFVGIQKKVGESAKELSNRISKDEFYSYYVEQNHTQKETQEHFNITESQIISLIRYFNAYKKDKLSNALLKISEDELYNKYIVENCSPYKLSKELGISVDMMYEIIRHYNLCGLRMDSITRIAKKASMDDLFNYYVENKHSITDTKIHFSLTDWEFKQIVKYYNITNRSGVSGYEDEIIKYLPENTEIIRNDRKILGNGKELDIYLPKYHIGIEFNGDYWHSSLQKEKNYHYDKSRAAETMGIRLIHIFEYEWNDPNKKNKIISIIKSATQQITERIFARKCDVREITNREAREFNNNNHLMGHRNATITYGLFLDNELIQLMSFSKSKYNKNLSEGNNWEIIRSCQKLNCVVVGGVSKLFTHFIKTNSPSSVFSYCDFNKFDGGGYELLGMEFSGYTGPDMSWVLRFSPDVVVPRNPSKNHELREQAIAQIWGAGSKKYVYRNLQCGE